MGNFNRDRGAGNKFGKRGGGGFGGGNRGGGGRGFGGRGDRPQMHGAVCDQCDNDCQVPFRPTGDRPVLCSDCFDRSKGGSGDRRDNRKSFRNETSAPVQKEESSKKHDEIIAKLDKIITLLQRTNSVKEVTVMKTEEIKEEVKEEVEEKPKKVSAKKKSAAKKTPAKKTAVKKTSAGKKKAAPKKKK